MNAFSKNLKKLRENEGLYQKELAEILNVEQPTVARWENGQVPKSFEQLSILAETLNTTIDELLNSEFLKTMKKEPALKLTSNQQKILNEIQDIDETDLPQIIGYIQGFKENIKGNISKNGK